MSFFVVERSAADGTVRALMPGTFNERSDALEGLSAAIAAGDISITGEVFVVDLSLATPVLVVPTGRADTPTGEPAVEHTADAEPQDAEEAADYGAAEARELSVVTPLPAPVSDPTLAGEGMLAAALKRAASSLESEGIVAPASIDAGPEGEAVSDADMIDPGSGVEEPTVTEAGEPVPDTAEASEASVIAQPGAAASLEDESSWPWTNIEAYEAPADVSVEVDDEGAGTQDVAALIESLGEEPGSTTAESADVFAGGAGSLSGESDAEMASTEDALEPEPESGGSAPVAEPLDEPEVSESPLIMTSVLDGDEAYLPRPVILGDYDDAPTEASALEEPVTLVAEPTSVLEYQTLSAAPADEPDVVEPTTENRVTDASTELAVEPEPSEAVEVEPAPSTDATEPAEPAAEADVGPLGFEATGELDLGSYTCDECVYVNTCPKVGESSPEECGSFQWRTH